MSGIGTALAAAVNGFVGGRDVKHRWQDRTDDKVRQKRRDEILDAQESRAQDRHGLDMTTGGLMNDARRRDLQSWDRDWDDWNSRRGAMDQADAAAMSGMGGQGAGPALGALPDQPQQSQIAPAPTAGGLSFGANAGPELSATVSTKSPLSFGRAVTGPVRAEAAAAPQQAAASAAPDTQIAPTGDDALFRPAPNGQVYATRGPRNAEERAQITQAAQENRLAVSNDRLREQAAIDRQHIGPDTTYSMEDWRGMSRGERRSADLPVSELGGQGYFDRFSVGLGATPPRKGGRADEAAAAEWTAARQEASPMPERTANPDHQWLQPGGLGADLREADTRVAGGLRGVSGAFGEQVQNTGVDALDTFNAPFRWMSEYATGKDHIGSPGRVDRDGDGKTSSLISPILDLFNPGAETPEKAAAALSKETGRDVKPAEAELAAQTAATLNDAGDDPGLAAAAEAMPMDALGAQRGQPMSERQRQRAAKTYLESYRENGAPIVMRELMRQGRFDDAEKFNTFMRSQEAQAGMEKWGEGMFAALSGDADKVMDFLSDAYNTPGYYEDGYQVVKPESELIRDRSGNPVGIKLTLQHQATGEKVTQTGNVNEIMQHFLWKVSPQEAFNAYNAKQSALASAIADQEKARTASANRIIERDFAAQVTGVDDAAMKLMEQAQFGGESLTYEEARRRVIAARASGGGGGNADGLPEDAPPVAYAPN